MVDISKAAWRNGIAGTRKTRSDSEDAEADQRSPEETDQRKQLIRYNSPLGCNLQEYTLTAAETPGSER